MPPLRYACNFCRDCSTLSGLNENQMNALSADSDHFALHRLLLRGVGNDDTTGGLFFFFDAADDHAVVERAKFHGVDLNV